MFEIEDIAMKLEFPEVLLIDDDVLFGEALSRWLSELGYRPSVATSAAEGVALLERGDFKAILIDLQLPDLSGHAIIRQLKNAGSTIPVIVVSGTTDMDDIIRAWREEAADFLRKPFRIDDLSVALDKALKRDSEVSSTPPAPASRPTRPAGADPGAPPPSARAAPAAASPAPPQRPRPSAVGLIDNLKAGAVRLPVLDPRVARLPEFLSRRDWSIDELVDTVTGDSSLSAGILRSANSIAYSRGKEIASMREACTWLGSKAIVAIAFEITVKGQFAVPQEPFRTALKGSWRNAIVASRAAPLLAEVLQLPDREDLRLLTLFHNVGELAALSMLAELDRPSAVAMTPAQLAIEVEAVHEELGAVLATSWRLPTPLIRLAGHHHRPAREPEPKDEKLIRHLVLASWAIAQRAGYTYFPDQAGVGLEASLKEIGLSEAQVTPILEKIKAWRVDA